MPTTILREFLFLTVGLVIGVATLRMVGPCEEVIATRMEWMGGHLRLHTIAETV